MLMPFSYVAYYQVLVYCLLKKLLKMLSLFKLKCNHFEVSLIPPTFFTHLHAIASLHQENFVISGVLFSLSCFVGLVIFPFLKILSNSLYCIFVPSNITPCSHI